MNFKRQSALDRLLSTLTSQQIKDLHIVIKTAEIERDDYWNEEGSYSVDDTQRTLDYLAKEIEIQ